MKLLIVVLLVAYASADVSHVVGRPEDANAKIVRQEQDSGVDGQYQWGFETDNGIVANEQGGLKTVPGAEGPSEVVQGQARYTAPGGEVIELSYTADENGFVAQGAHIPTSPPIPEAIARALEYIAAHPPPQEVQGKKLN